MRLALVCAAALLALPAFAHHEDLVATEGADQVRLSESECSSAKVLQQLKGSRLVRLKNATATVEGHTFKACWFEHAGTALLLYEDGDEGEVPLSDFRWPI